jgi:hypothetical protein
MPITVKCPSCDGEMSAPDRAVGKKGKCPKCGQVLVIPGPPDPSGVIELVSDSPYAAPKVAPSRDDDFDGLRRQGPALAVISGKAATAFGGGIVRASFGRTTLVLQTNRVIETTRRPIAARDCELLLSEVESAEIITKSNPVWLVLGFLTFALYGLGLIFFVLFFVLKHRFLIVHSRGNAVFVSFDGDDGPYRQFMEAVLTEAERARAAR